MKKCFFVLTGLLLSSFGLFAQKQVVIEHDYSAFDAISATDYFEIAIIPSDDYSIKITTDYLFEDYIQAYVKDGVLYISVDEKGMPSDVKKSFKAKSSALAVPKAEVYLPDLKSLTINGDATLNCERKVAADDLAICLSKSAIIRKAAFEVDNLTLNMSQKAQAYNMTADVLTLDIQATNNARASIKVAADSLKVNTSSFADIELYGSSDYISFVSGGNSKIEFETSR